MPAKRQPSAPDEEGRAGDPRQERYEVTGNWKHLKKRPRKSQPSAGEMLRWLEQTRATVYASTDEERGALEHWVVVPETATSRRGNLGDTLPAAIRAAMAAERKERQ